MYGSTSRRPEKNRIPQRNGRQNASPTTASNYITVGEGSPLPKKEKITAKSEAPSERGLPTESGERAIKQEAKRLPYNCSAFYNRRGDHWSPEKKKGSPPRKRSIRESPLREERKDLTATHPICHSERSLRSEESLYVVPCLTGSFATLRMTQRV